MGGLFEDLSDQPVPARPWAGEGEARLRRPDRVSGRMEIIDLEGLIGESHKARLIWSYAERVDFSDFEERVRAREGTAGRAQTAPPLLLALWLYGVIDGVGSAREIARLCEVDAPYRWLCGGVTVNHHALSDFRATEGGRIERELVAHVASLSLAGLIDLDEVAQDGVKVRASAGAASFRRRKTLEAALFEAEGLLQALTKDETNDPGSAGRRRMARQARAAAERLTQVEAALVTLKAAEAQRVVRDKTNKGQTRRQGEPRASTTDPEARVMKMADGGFRPAYNVQFASLPSSGIVIGVIVTTAGTDKGRAEPMAQTIAAAYGRRPLRHLVDGGYQQAGDIEAAHQAGTTLYSPPQKAKSGADPHAPKAGDGPGVAAWRQRMAIPEAKTIYGRRSRCELVHAKLRNLHLDRLLVRGQAKVQAWMTGFALAMNIITEARLRDCQLV